MKELFFETRNLNKYEKKENNKSFLCMFLLIQTNAIMTQTKYSLSINLINLFDILSKKLLVKERKAMILIAVNMQKKLIS